MALRWPHLAVPRRREHHRGEDLGSWQAVLIMKYGYGRKPTSRPAIELALAAERMEYRCPAAVAIIVAADLRVATAPYPVQPAWVVPAVLLALLAVPIAGDPGHSTGRRRCGGYLWAS